MSAHQGIRVTSSTSGTPAPGIEHLSGGYRFQRDPGWSPNDPRYRDEVTGREPGASALTPERERRLREFAAHRAAGLSIPQAGGRLGVKPKTAYAYERDWRALQRRERTR